MSKFTQGKWEYEEYVPNGVTINGKEYIIFTGSVDPQEEGADIALAKREADARLIAAAPEMYELLKVWTQIGVQPDLMIANDKARQLLANIDGLEDSHD